MTDGDPFGGFHTIYFKCLFMGFNKCFLPPIDSMKKDILNNGLESFIRKYQKCDAIIGESDGVTFLDNIMKTESKYLY